MQVPEPVRKVFGAFPLHTDPGVPVDGRGIPEYGSPQTLYVYKLDADGLATDPEGLECQSTFRAANRKPLVLPGSLHVSSKGKLPHVVEKVGDRFNVYGDAKHIQPSSDGGTSHTQVFHSLIKISLGDAWRLTMLQNEAIKREIYNCEGTVAGHIGSSEINAVLLRELDARHSKFVETHRSYCYSGPFGSSSTTRKVAETTQREIMDQAEDCMQVFDTFLQNNDGVYLQADDRGLGPQDLALFSYVYLIKTYLEATELGQMLKRHPLLLQHCKRVYQELYL